MRKQLDKIFQPKRIAVIGASNRPNSIGYTLMENLLEGNYKGELYPINLKYNKIHGLPSYRYIKQVPEQVDLVIIAIPARSVARVLKDCGKVGIKGVLIISAGFREAGEEGQLMYQDILATAREYGIRVIGPSSLGFISTHLGLNASGTRQKIRQGNIAFISQSGALGTAVLDWAENAQVGFSYFVSAGSMIDVSFADLIDYLGSDHRTSCILIYMETLQAARRFMSAARAFARFKPILVLKAGRSLAGSQIAFSHTGNLAGNDAAFDAAFNRSGIIRVDTIAQLFNCAQSLAMQPRPSGKRLAIVSNAGAPSILATDYLMKNGGELAPLTPKSKDGLQVILGANKRLNGSIKLPGAVDAQTYEAVLKIIKRDHTVDGILVILTNQFETDPVAVAQATVKALKGSNKLILASWMGEAKVREARTLLEQARIPNYRFPESAADVFLKMHAYARKLEMLYETPVDLSSGFRPNIEQAKALIKDRLAEGRFRLAEHESKAILQAYNIPLAPHYLAQSDEEAIHYAAKIGFPVVLKIVSADINHKTEIGGIQLNLNSMDEVREAYQLIWSNVKRLLPDVHVMGVLVEKMIKKPHELLIGAKKDPIFGPVILFGQGGVGVEVFKDISIGLPPLNMALAQQIIEGTRIYKLLKGYRGMEGADLNYLSQVLCQFAYLLMDFPEIAELDINPFVIDSQGGIVLDAHIVLDRPSEKRRSDRFQHLVISPYPEQYTRKVEMKNGQTALLRPIRAEDEPLEAKMIDYLSKETVYFRFFGYMPKVTHEWLSRFTHIDYDREMAIIAEIEEEGEKKMIGVVRIISDAWMEGAEYAIVVADPWQGLGLGRKLTNFILEIAKDKGIKKIFATVLSGNQGMIGLFKKLGFKFHREDYETFYVELDMKDLKL